MHNAPVKIFKGQAFIKTPQKASTSQKIIIFDLDETLGSFGDLYILWNTIYPLIPLSIDSATVFRELLYIYPEFLRPGIIPILEFLNYKKLSGICSRVFLYTNNQCPPEWVHRILKFFDEKIPNLFDQAIYAFKIGDQRIEPLRTRHSKTYSDLIRCTMMPRNSEMCFIDNSYHTKMVNERVYYIQPRSYEHGLSGEDIINRFLNKWTAFPLPIDCENKLRTNCIFRKPTYFDSSAAVVSQKIMYHLKEYFLLSTKVAKTKKIVWHLGRFTRKKR